MSRRFWDGERWDMADVNAYNAAVVEMCRTKRAVARQRLPEVRAVQASLDAAAAAENARKAAHVARVVAEAAARARAHQDALDAIEERRLARLDALRAKSG